MDPFCSGTNKCRSKILIYRLLWHPERTPNPDSLQFARVNQAVNGHQGDAHDRGNFPDSQKTNIA